MKLRFKKLKDYTLLDIINVSAVFITLLVFSLIIITLNRGMCSDECFYLLGYRKQQLIGDCLTQFHYIIRPIASLFYDPYVNIGLRWVDLVLLTLSLLFFSSSTFNYLKENFKINISKQLFFSITILAGFMGFNFASSVLCYNNLQPILYLIVLGLLFFSVGKKLITEFVSHFLAGFFILFAVFNYLPSGIDLFIIYITLLLFLPKVFNFKFFIKNSLYLILGFCVAIIFYHFAIYNIEASLSSMLSPMKYASSLGHGNNVLMKTVVVYGFYIIVFFSISLIVGLVFFYLLNRFKSKWIYFFLLLPFIFIIIFHTLFRKYFSCSLIVPISFVIADILIKVFNGDKIKTTLREIILFLVLFLIPLAGTFGTNVPIASKAYGFMPFWIIAFMIIYSKVKGGNVKSTIFIYSFLWLAFLFISYFEWLYFKRYTYTSPLGECKYELEDNSILSIKISQEQKLFDDNAIRILKSNGFKHGDEILAFCENFATVYSAGAYIPGKLYFSCEQYMFNKNNITIKPSNYILIFQQYEKPLTYFLKNTDWRFPENYKRIDLGVLAHGIYLPVPENHSILFVRKDKIQ